ncbi:DJ-1/PfpI family protein [Leptospira ilyithenensis]|uniref:DJ-1/PfpI domain-containing protein n=1 Tax=Leptospira ilyithenensis TaxID=2484901 RepID=A0A4R9LN14_9LEPT|nr:DJ-1/PfpI family protein [Leptospira ilyithenensis]TGN10089.1 hypothetical protein EHS11_11050 [Leptospira ilyithenensis]
MLFESHLGSRRLPVFPFALISFLFAFGCAQLQGFNKVDIMDVSVLSQKSYKVNHDPSKHTVVILADSEGTEITDLLVPFSLLKQSGFNVYILSNKRSPVILWKGLVVLPHFLVTEFPYEYDAVVVPYLTHTEDPALISFLSKTDKKILSVCEGARLIGNTGKFNGRNMTTHATSIFELEAKYPWIKWQRGKKYETDGNLTSTAGVASSIEGSLFLIRELAGETALQNTMKNINYPFATLRRDYPGEPVSFSDKFTIAKKVLFDDDPKIAIEIYQGIDEMNLALTLDAWARTFPLKIEAVAKGFVKSKNGLLLSGAQNYLDHDLRICPGQCDEKAFSKRTLHVSDKKAFSLDANLELIKKEYGERFSKTVRRMIDY